MRLCITCKWFSIPFFNLCKNANKFKSYGYPFIHHTYLHHLTRIDHRHNFSPYSTVLYLNSSPVASPTLHFESLAFIPQLFLSVVALPLALAKKDLAATMLAQTFAFVAWNKVCTSQVRISLPVKKHLTLTNFESTFFGT